MVLKVKKKRNKDKSDNIKDIWIKTQSSNAINEQSYGRG
jgi:hypothetical protein